MRRFAVPAALFVLCLPTAALPADSTPPTKVADFTLTDVVADKPVSLRDFQAKKAVVVVFIGTECPINNAYMPRLAELSKACADKGVAFVAINSNCNDAPPRIAGHAKKYDLPFPVLRDPANVVADQFGAQRTPEAFLLDGSRNVVYRGRIDDQYGVGYRSKAPTRRDLAEAIDETLAGKPVSQPSTKVAGCFIERTVKPKDSGTITFSKDAARVLQRNCQDCHRPGQVAPMPLLTYEDAVAWSDTIREVVQQKRMPPWLADPHFGKFQNDRTLADADRSTLLGWIDQGCPKGDPADMPPAKEFSEGWSIGKPDAVFTMPDEYTVRADAGPRGLKYQYFIVPTHFNEDRWIQAAEAKPGNPAVVHHIIVYVVKPGIDGLMREKTGDGIGDGFLTAFAPGELGTVLAPGTAKKLPKGAILAFQMHYTPNGVEQKDQSSVALVFAKEPPKIEVRTRAIAQKRLSIPAGDANYEAKSEAVFDKDADLLSFLPHMHLRGKDFKYEVVYPDGKRETLLSVPHYDFAWQSTYRLEKPLHLPAGTKIECTAHYDNSKDNLNNPDPTKIVRWGDQTWDEMMIGFVDYAYTK
ncbi:MAG TPA: thioredoxin family protein [Gemmataceae bacterium]|nr:thioredoxin family protein [Gemmataceae bacterium]